MPFGPDAELGGPLTTPTHPLAPLRQDDDPVAQILSASTSRQILDCRERDGSPGSLDAEAVRQACGISAARDPFGIRIANARLNGSLDLRFMSIAEPLQFLGCRFEQALHLAGAQLTQLLVTSGEYLRPELAPHVGASSLPGLVADGLRVRRDLVLSGTHVTGRIRRMASLSKTSAIWLNEAEVGGRLVAVGTRIETEADRALQADRMSVHGDVRLVGGFHANAEIRLLAAHIGGSLDLTSAVIDTGGAALDLTTARIGGSLFLIDDPDADRRPRIVGRVDLGNAHLGGRVHLRRATLLAPRSGSRGHDHEADEGTVRVAVNGPGLTVDGELLVEPGSVIDGALRLPAAVLRGGVRMLGTLVQNPGDQALVLSQADLGSGLDLEDCQLLGTFNAAYARISGPLRLRGCRFTEPADRHCIVGIGLRAEGDLDLVGLSARGGRLNFRNAAVAGVVNAERATIDNQSDATLSLHQAHVGGNLRLCKGFVSEGIVVLNRAVIDGRVRCDGGSFAWVAAGRPAGGGPDPVWNPRGSAVEAISARFRTGVGLGWQIRSGGVDLTDALTSYLADDPGSDWPPDTYLTGFAYERFAPLEAMQGSGEWRAEVRVAWLAGLAQHDPRPWGQVATVLAANGDHTGAEYVLMARRRHERRIRVGGQRYFWRRMLDRLEDLLIGYGYRPQRVLVVMLALVAAVTLTLAVPAWRSSMRATDPAGTVFAPRGPVAAATESRCGNGAVRCLEPVLYAVDTVVPIIDLKQRATWYPATDAGGAWLEWWLNACTILGWIASTVFAVSLTRLGRSTL